jgi:3-oxoacyl-(acyl-carrier-protein) synthase
LGEAEAAALRQVFPSSKMPTIMDVKSRIGETIGAAESFSMIAAAEALNRQTVPKGLMRAHPDGVSRGSSELKYALVNCYEYGGNVNSILVKRYE